jgi:hypothetical protein
LDGQTLDYLHLLVFQKPNVTSFGEEKTWWLYGKRVQWHLWSVRFSQQLKLRSQLSRMWHPVVWYIGTNVLEGFAAFIFGVRECTTCLTIVEGRDGQKFS